MLEQYRTVRKEASAEIVIRKSRFIGHARHVASEEEAIAFVERIKKEHKTATHNCFAYVVGDGDQYQKQSDDGEPSGTAGKPILETIKQQKLKYTAVVVTRYFGGIMLGAGGLIRAYTDGAVAGLAAAEPVTVALHRKVQVEVDYTQYGKVENELRLRGTLLGETTFADKVAVVCWPRESESASFVEWMMDLTQGRANITLGEVSYKEV
jgi:uncharacterized YigZ family protein